MSPLLDLAHSRSRGGCLGKGPKYYSRGLDGERWEGQCRWSFSRKTKGRKEGGRSERRGPPYELEEGRTRSARLVWYLGCVGKRQPKGT